MEKNTTGVLALFLGSVENVIAEEVENNLSKGHDGLDDCVVQWKI